MFFSISANFDVSHVLNSCFDIVWLESRIKGNFKA